MSRFQRIPFAVRYGFLVGCLALSTGCLQMAHGIVPPETDIVQACLGLPKCSRDHVYIFMIHGMDPFDYANLSGVNKYFHRLGFHNTYYGQLYHTAALNREVRRIHQTDPEARFVLIGFSFGANMVRKITQDVKQENIAIDLLVYFGGNTLKNIPRDRPENAKQIVNILASGCIWNGAWMDDAINMHVTDVWHFGSPSHPESLKTLTVELYKVGQSVPVVVTETKKVQPFSNDGPVPRPIMPRSVKNDGWDFLMPVDRLQITFDTKATPIAPKSNPTLVTRVAGRDN